MLLGTRKSQWKGGNKVAWTTVDRDCNALLPPGNHFTDKLGAPISPFCSYIRHLLLESVLFKRKVDRYEMEVKQSPGHNQ